MAQSPLNGLRTVIYRVKDLEKSRDWYFRVFGITPYFDQPFYVGFNIGGYELGLDPDLSDGAPGKGGVTAYWGVTDVPATYRAALSSGAAPHSQPKDVGEGIIVASVQDPDGNIIGLIQNPHFVVTK